MCGRALPGSAGLSQGSGNLSPLLGRCPCQHRPALRDKERGRGTAGRWLRGCPGTPLLLPARRDSASRGWAGSGMRGTGSRTRYGRAPGKRSCPSALRAAPASRRGLKAANTPPPQPPPNNKTIIITIVIINPKCINNCPRKLPVPLSCCPSPAGEGEGEAARDAPVRLPGRGARGGEAAPLRPARRFLSALPRRTARPRRLHPLPTLWCGARAAPPRCPQRGRPQQGAGPAMAGIGIDHSKLPGVKEGAAPPGAGRRGRWTGRGGVGEMGTRQEGNCWFGVVFLKRYYFSISRRRCGRGAGGEPGQREGTGRSVPRPWPRGSRGCPAAGAGCPAGGGRGREAEAGGGAAAVAGQSRSGWTGSRGRSAGLASGSPPRQSGGGRAGSAAAPREQRARSGAGGGRAQPFVCAGAEAAAGAAAALPPPRPGSRAGGAGRGCAPAGCEAAGAPCGRWTSSDVCLSVRLSVPGSYGSAGVGGSAWAVGKMGVELWVSTDLAI